jgi:hypothetical protein
MKTFCIAAVLALTPFHQAWAWGQEGHSIVAEIAQRRLNDAAAAVVNKLLERASLASIASWADDIRTDNKATTQWHFVDIPISSDHLDRARDCKPDEEGDCVVAELERLKGELRCGTDDHVKAEALKFAVHFVGDIHQPLHTVLEERGGNGIEVTVTMRGNTGKKDAPPAKDNLHAVWDATLIQKIVFAWGSLVTRIENGWLTSAEAKGADKSRPADWAVETHKVAQTVWAMTPANKTLDDDYFAKTVPIIERQLGVAGLRLARFLNEAYAPNQPPCP